MKISRIVFELQCGHDFVTDRRPGQKQYVSQPYTGRHNLRNATDWSYSEAVQTDTWEQLERVVYSDNLDGQLEYSIQDTEVATRKLNQN